jgi:RnfABCDGE-type electron transport complex G subunit
MSAQKINIPMLGLFLGAVSAISAGLLSGVNAVTTPKIIANQKAAADAAIIQVLPEFDNIPGEEVHTFKSAMGWEVTYYTARKDSEIVGFAGKVVTPEGFPDGDGDITLMIGLQPDGTVGTVLVTAASETPGLGTVVTDRKQQKTIVDLFSGAEEEAGLVANKFLDWYTGKKADEARWTIVKDGESVNGKTGATITSAAIGGAVHAISRTATDHLETLSKGAE